VPQATRLALVRTVFAAIRRDAPGVVDGFYALGIVAPGVERHVVERLVQTLLGIAYERTTAQERLEFVNRELLSDEVVETLYDFPVLLPPDMVYFARTAALIEGLGARYDPRFNVLTVVAPIALRMRREILASLGQLPASVAPAPIQAVSGFFRAARGVVSRAARELGTLAIETAATIQQSQDTRSGQERSISSRAITAGSVSASATQERPGSGEPRR